MAAPSKRGAQPNHCPYCGDSNLWPHDPDATSDVAGSGWECRSCLRAFEVTYQGMITRNETRS